MKPTISSFGAILYSPNQYVIPVFQRHYRWDVAEWEKLWENLRELRQPGVKGNHFMGFLVSVPGLPQPGKIVTFHLVDGQQRLTTLSVLLIALRNVAKVQQLIPFAEEIHNYYLVHPPKRDNEHYRLFPKERDNEDYISAVKGNNEAKGKIGQALRFFEDKLTSAAPESWESELRAMFELICQRLEFMCATLEHENAYNIFKSLNSTGVPLEAADLIRNFVFMHVPPDDQDEFDRDLWRPLEARFSDSFGNFNGGEFSRFFRDFLMRNGRYVSPKATFETFEERYEATEFSPVELAKELTTFANYYETILGRKNEPSPTVGMALSRLRALESSTTNPLLLNLFCRREQGKFTDADLTGALNMLNGFILRRFICGDSSRGYGRLFVRACMVLTTSDDPFLKLSEFLLDEGWPDGYRFKSAFCKFDLYPSAYCRFILESLESANGHKEPADLSAAQVEHIMPQTLSETWRVDLGVEAERIYGEWLHKPGNLTLSAYNRELWNHPFAEKRTQYKQSNIVITRQLEEQCKWGEVEIQARGQALAEMANKIWPGPAGLDEYR